jgi:hypothetical protein
MTSNSVIRMAILLSILSLAGHTIRGQQTTNTNCNTNGSMTNCTSTTTDNGAQQQRAYEAGQQLGNAIGSGLVAAMQSHSHNSWVKKYCAAHPGEDWRWFRKSDGRTIDSGRCPSDEDKGAIAANEFMAHHKDFIRGPENSKVMVAYLEDHRLDPREQKSYERAYKDLKKTSQLSLYSK